MKQKNKKEISIKLEKKKKFNKNLKKPKKKIF